SQVEGVGLRRRRPAGPARTEAGAAAEWSGRSQGCEPGGRVGVGVSRRTGGGARSGASGLLARSGCRELLRAALAAVCRAHPGEARARCRGGAAGEVGLVELSAVVGGDAWGRGNGRAGGPGVAAGRVVLW